MAAAALAIWFTRGRYSIFVLIQNVGAWVAAPIAVVFLLGVLWRRATAQAATFVLFFGFPYTAFVEYVLFKRVELLQPYDNWLNRTFAVWATCLVVMVLLSYLTTPPRREQVQDIIWSPDDLHLPAHERALHRGFRSLFVWWALFIGVMALLYAYVIWFQFWGPGRAV
jgi:SSS family solute:Na+ symporter